LLDNYFQGSFKSMVSFFVKKNDVDLQDVEALLKEIDKEKKR
jgi:BlaI family penicillinase repressor